MLLFILMRVHYVTQMAVSAVGPKRWMSSSNLTWAATARILVFEYAPSSQKEASVIISLGKFNWKWKILSVWKAYSYMKPKCRHANKISLVLVKSFRTTEAKMMAGHITKAIEIAAEIKVKTRLYLPLNMQCFMFGWKPWHWQQSDDVMKIFLTSNEITDLQSNLKILHFSRIKSKSL